MAKHSRNEENKTVPGAGTPANHDANNPHGSIMVWDRLEVGPIKVERKRLIAPYRVVMNDGSEDTINLIYTYGENVFEPGNPVDQNLADMIGAQVAFNYGLFCKHLIFRGTYDDADQGFIRDMVENTSTEIYVKKFLEHNPFLLGEAAKLPLIKKSHYTQASIEFPDADKEAAKAHHVPWNSRPERHLILSSGGKDSLLSYALIHELGLETHPIYVNESGRHWFTALNAHRHFNENIPNTGRVWTNCDRVFVWMKHHMPFIRQDFARFRADEYPIRLWTVAVFLFGVLPLMRKRQLGRLLIGDEYDTTRKSSFEGITHYDGLFDQSQYFDRILTGYYHRKEWNIDQFSVLRPVSELMIQKILVTRYPELQMHQVSCHAAHKENDRILPCGVCEKCRRIIGMLKAFGVDPSCCGYKESQVEGAIEGIVTRGINQESAGVNHLISMLAEKGLVPYELLNGREPEPHPEVMKLRFHPECSPVDGIPEDLRKPLHRIFLKHADGAIQWVGDEWVPITL